MSVIDLVHPGEVRRVPVAQLMNKCTLFRNNPSLLGAPYAVRSSVPLDAFRDFVSALDDCLNVSINDGNFPGLSELSSEFGFDALAARLSVFRPSPGLRDGLPVEIRARLLALEGRGAQYERQIEELRAGLPQARDILARLNRVEATLARPDRPQEILARLERIEATLARPDRPQETLARLDRVEATLARLDRPQEIVARLERIEATLARPDRPGATSGEGDRGQAPGRARQTPPPPPASPRPPPSSGRPGPTAIARPDSLIIDAIPPILSEFREQRWQLLWRGSRDGFEPNNFQDRCVGHANTVTIILDKNGNIFGGFTPVPWELGEDFKEDESVRSFIFTLKNPHNFPPRKFPLKREKRFKAIGCHPQCCTTFGNIDMRVREHCYYAGARNFTRHDTKWNQWAYANDSGIEHVFTGDHFFVVKEIEVFEITN
jgi:hypothetical protein